MSTNLHLSVLPPAQQQVWRVFCQQVSFLRQYRFYLAGGTALALQLGHRQSVDFGFFTQERGMGSLVEEWLVQLTGAAVRDRDADTLHGELQSVFVSFIGGYRYPTIEPLVVSEGLSLANLLDIALMKLLAITHRATVRDYVDLAAILRSGVDLQALLERATAKYGPQFNPLVALRSLASFDSDDIDHEMPLMRDNELAHSWRAILAEAIQGLTKS